MKTPAFLLLHPWLALALAGAGCDVGPDAGPQQRSDQEIRGDFSAEPEADSAMDQDRVCWTDRDCGDGELCRGARVCPPGALCGPLADQPGTCASPEPYCELDGRRYRPGEVFGPCDACECRSDGSILCRDFACLECRSDAECPEGFVCELPLDCPPGALCRPLAEPAGYCMPAGPSAKAACAPEECGPAPLMPNRLCEDGVHYSGPSGRCLRGDDGDCSHEILSCPACTLDSCDTDGR